MLLDSYSKQQWHGKHFWKIIQHYIAVSTSMQLITGSESYIAIGRADYKTHLSTVCNLISYQIGYQIWKTFVVFVFYRQGINETAVSDQGSQANICSVTFKSRVGNLLPINLWNRPSVQLGHMIQLNQGQITGVNRKDFSIKKYFCLLHTKQSRFLQRSLISSLYSLNNKS